MNIQSEPLPAGATLVGSTPTMTETSISPGLLAAHMAPRGKCGRLVVEEGACQFIWEDEPDSPIDCDPAHPVVIAAERLHHVVITGPVKLRVEFYTLPVSLDALDPDAARPGEDHLDE